MTFRIFVGIAGSVLTAAAVTVTLAIPASAQPATPPPKDPAVGASGTVACGISYPVRDSSGFHRFPANTVTLRSGPSNSCIQTGQGLPDQLAQYLCYTPGDGGTWTFLRNVSTGDQGWVRDDLLAGNGSQVPCEDNPSPASILKPVTSPGHDRNENGVAASTRTSGSPTRDRSFL